MAQVYGIPQYPVYSPLAGIADLYKTYKELERQDALDAYAKEKDARTYALEQQKVNDQKAYQQGMLTDRQGERQENYASNWMRNELTRQKMEQDARIANCNGEDANTPQCLQAKAYTMRMNNESGQQGLPPELVQMLDNEAYRKGTTASTLRTLASLNAGKLGANQLTGDQMFDIPGAGVHGLGADGSLYWLGNGTTPKAVPDQVIPQIGKLQLPQTPQQIEQQPLRATRGTVRGLDEWSNFNGCRQMVNGEIRCQK